MNTSISARESHLQLSFVLSSPRQLRRGHQAWLSLAQYKISEEDLSSLKKGGLHYQRIQQMVVEWTENG